MAAVGVMLTLSVQDASAQTITNGTDGWTLSDPQTDANGCISRTFTNCVNNASITCTSCGDGTPYVATGHTANVSDAAAAAAERVNRFETTAIRN